MKARSLILGLLFAIIVLGGGGLWLLLMHPVPAWEPRALPAETREQPLLLAERFLAANGARPRQVNELAPAAMALQEVDVLVLPWRSRNTTKADQQALQDWVARGGVLLTSAGEIDYDDDEQVVDHRSDDPLLHLLDLQHHAGSLPPEGDGKQASDYYRTVQLPGLSHAVQFEGRGLAQLQAGQIRPAWTDDSGALLLGYRHGRGWIVIASETDQLLTNWNLADADHAELLWAISRLNTAEPRVWLVRTQDTLPWYELLWQKLPYPLLGTLLALLLWLWRAGSRFGPLLPEMAAARRAILEHIDASARWLWQHDRGREHLLATVRSALRERIANRLPELSRLPDAELVRLLALRYDISAVALEQALTGRAPKHPAQFTNRIALLQSLRNRL
ncbi:DUF4350 domain-containing protein [Chitinilyticum piscinae]|uniref:DUF4350 domain-containing protein n=1 Tax=Chitinilyticum piscinae TaxID=2866724 RepID=A0A8J7FN12_9NEIS|nr:DUF4350 domain-containing protein [Chitinilyticum piscinae]MBE9609164.1 hypothetical protein [Chitinilyticum piscinae]